MNRSPLLTARGLLTAALILIPVLLALALVLPQLKKLDLKELISSIGYGGLFAIVFAESGLYFGFFLPGDSLLFTAGLLASPGLGERRVFDLLQLVILLFLAAVIGDSAGYWSGQKFGRRFFQREDSFWFHRKHLDRAHDFYERHGGKAIVLARFLPVVRTFVPIVAGMALMPYPKFLVYNLLGGLTWVISMIVGGYFFGSLLPPEEVDRYLLPVIALIIVLSAAPTAFHLYRENRAAIRYWLRRSGRPSQ